MRLYHFIFLIFLAPRYLLAQPDFNYAEIKNKYPDKDAFILLNKTTFKIEVINGLLNITENNENYTLLLSDNASSFSSHSISYYEEREEISNVKATSFIPNERNILKKLEVENILIQKPQRENVFYDDYKEIYFRYPGLKNGSVTSLSYSKKLKDPIFLNPFYFVTHFPIQEAIFSVTFPKGMSVKYLLSGDTTGIQFTFVENKKTVTMTWIAKNKKGYNGEQDSYNIKKIFPHIIFYVGEYATEEKTIPVLNNTKELYRWFSSHTKQLLIEPDSQIKILSDSITRNTNNDEEKIKKIYYWVQKNIKYIAFEQGLGGYIPRPASLVCSRRYGDCKDKTSILYALLKAAGYKSYFTWVGTRDIPYSFSELSSPFLCNHMILSLHNEHGWTFLDGTSDHLPLGYPSFSIQNKEAMISISTDSFVIEKIPVINKEKNVRTDSLLLNVDQKLLSGTGKTLFTGFMKNKMDNYYFDIATNDRDKEIEKLFIFGNNKCKTKISGYKGEDSFSDTLFCYYTYEITDYISKIGNKLFINMNLMKDLPGETIDTLKEINDRNYFFKSIQNKFYTLKIPENYIVKVVPSDSTFNGEGFGLKLHYQIYPDKITLENSIWIDDISFHKSSFNSWNKMIAALNKVYSDVIIMETK